LSYVAAAQAKAGDVKAALRTADAIEERYRQGEAAKEVVLAQLGAGDVKGALQTAGVIKSIYWRVEALAEVAKAQAKTDRVAAADTFRKAFAEAGQDGGLVRDEEPGWGSLRNAAVCHLLQAQAEAGFEKEAAAYASDRDAPRLRTQALTSVARGLVARQEAEKRPRE
jgi:hypothetical protein